MRIINRQYYTVVTFQWFCSIFPGVAEPMFHGCCNSLIARWGNTEEYSPAQTGDLTGAVVCTLLVWMITLRFQIQEEYAQLVIIWLLENGGFSSVWSESLVILYHTWFYGCMQYWILNCGKKAVIIYTFCVKYGLEPALEIYLPISWSTKSRQQVSAAQPLFSLAHLISQAKS